MENERPVLVAESDSDTWISFFKVKKNLTLNNRFDVASFVQLYFFFLCILYYCLAENIQRKIFVNINVIFVIKYTVPFIMPDKEFHGCENNYGLNECINSP